MPTIAALLFVLAQYDPKNSLSLMAIIAVLIAFFSASQDIAFDAYRRELLKDEELGIAESFYVWLSNSDVDFGWCRYWFCWL